jgi:hypothetical protein
MKRVFILCWLTAGLLTLIVIGSITTADKTKYHNDFIRMFPPHFVTGVSTLKVDKGRFSLAGLTGTKIYLRDRSRSGLLVAGDDMSDTIRQSIPIPTNFEILVDSPWFFLSSGSVPAIKRGNISNWSVEAAFSELPGFTLMQPISRATAILRTIDMEKRKSIFIRSDSPNSPKDILKKQVDGILCTDGFLGYSKEYHQLVYIYRYRNQFLCLDTMLNVQLIGKTIDTTTVSKISVDEINGELKMSKPPLVVNKGSCVTGKYLFIHSNLTARNESIDQSKHNSVIDVYNILDGHYIYSFYIEDLEGTKMRSFKVKEHTLVALFPGYVVRYNLNPQYHSR